MFNGRLPSPTLALSISAASCLLRSRALLDISSFSSVEDLAQPRSVCTPVAAADGKKLASASFDNTVRLWDIKSGQPIGDAFTGHTDRVTHVIFSPDGRKLASASSDKALRLWDVESGQAIGDAFTSHADSVSHVIFSPDGKRLASASSDNTVRLWDIESDQPIGDAFTGHTAFFNSIGRSMSRTPRGVKRSPTPTSATFPPQDTSPLPPLPPPSPIPSPQ